MAQYVFPVVFDADEEEECAETWEVLSRALDDIHEGGEAPGLFIGKPAPAGLLDEAAGVLEQYRRLFDNAGLWGDETHSLREQTSGLLARIADLDLDKGDTEV